MNKRFSRRMFVAAASAASAAKAAAGPAKAALLGGEPVRKEPFSAWPVIGETDERAMLETLRSGRWFRGGGNMVNRFEQRYAALTGAAHCLATANGTSALMTSLNALGVGPGDEVIVPPYTFVATVNVVLLQHALPVFVDTDIETSQMDATRLEACITDRTAAIIPVHLGGNVADLDAILKIAGARKVPVVEDACQAHLAEWRGRKVGTLGTSGCFSFQASKNLNSGEGGAVLSNDGAFIERCYTFHNNSRPRKNPGMDFSYQQGVGANLRLTEFQAALLMSQMERIEEQARRREQNAAHLSKMLDEIPGISAAKTYSGCTRNAYHIFMMRYRAEAFGGLPRATFIKALRAEGVPCSPGYRPLNKDTFLRAALQSKSYKRVYPEKVLKQLDERNHCPNNDKLCEEAVWFGQTMLLGPRRDMDQIAEAIRKIHAQADALKKASA